MQDMIDGSIIASQGMGNPSGVKLEISDTIVQFVFDTLIRNIERSEEFKDARDFDALFLEHVNLLHSLLEGFDLNFSTI
jgi:hypothetical protein